MALAPAEQSNFAGGQIDSAVQRDPSKSVYKAGCVKARNMRIRTGGPIRVMPAIRAGMITGSP